MAIGGALAFSVVFGVLLPALANRSFLPYFVYSSLQFRERTNLTCAVILGFCSINAAVKLPICFDARY